MGKGGFILDWTERNWQAERIYRLLKQYAEEIEKVIDDVLEITIFDNCREQGYTLKYKGKEVSFAENRNSDDIVVYPFKWEGRSEEELDRDYMEKTKYFKYGQFKEALFWMLEYLGIHI